MIDPKALLKDLKGQVKALEADLRARAEDMDLPFAAELQVEHKAAFDAKRTAATYESWLEERITQSAVAWVLGTVFLRFCEDNGLLGEQRFLGGTGDAVTLAADTQAAWVLEGDGSRTDRDWIEHGFAAMSVSPVARGLFDRRHNPMYKVTPSHQAAKALIGFWRTEKEPGVPVHDFTSEDWDTRFLGDLYQDLSESARKTYALLQTPEFIEEFILDLTLDPAIEEFGYKELRCIDPTCGSGHFLLGAFKRLLAVWDEKSPGVDRTDRIAAALRSVHGVDKNPFAVAIARFRTLIAAMWEDLQETGNRELVGAPNFEINIAVGDSLLHGRGAPGQQGDLFTNQLKTEDVDIYVGHCDILGLGSYHAVFGNPPYIIVKDKQENKNYRAYKSCSGKYALSVPFAERFFHLAVPGGPQGSAGYVGQITANSFMKREFGKKLIEEFFAYKAHLTYIIDTSNVPIPGHGTPTVILIGRRYLQYSDSTIRVVLGVQGDQGKVAERADNPAWKAILDQYRKPGSESKWVSVVDAPRASLKRFPWSLSGGPARFLIERIESSSAELLKSKMAQAGFVAITAEDDAFHRDERWFDRRRIAPRRQVVIGEGIRDYRFHSGCWSIWPYNGDFSVSVLGKTSGLFKELWPNRRILQRRKRFGRVVESIPGFRWHEYGELYREKLATPLTISFAFVATHNHFILDRGGKVFKQTAPVIKLHTESEEDYVRIVGILNSSTACFWIKENSQSRGSSLDSEGARQSLAPWEDFFEHTVSRLAGFPLPRRYPTELGIELDLLARKMARLEPGAVLTGTAAPSRRLFDQASADQAHIMGKMVALQEELDWMTYGLYDIPGPADAAQLVAGLDSLPDLKLGERAFEIVLARRMVAGELQTDWFTRHGSTPITQLPTRWPESYRRVVEKRIEMIEGNREIGLIERPEYKRRWQQEPWEKREKAALRDWLLDRCEERALWFVADDSGREQPRAMTVAALAETLRRDADFVSVVRLYAGDDAKLDDVLAGLVEAEHVPYLAGFRYKESGLRKRAQWEDTWEKQREEDETGKSLNIPVPPKYTSADFLKTSYWSNRGKLDVPKERFISYPEANPDHVPGTRSKPTSLLLGWAGWDHREQAHALLTIIEERSAQDGWDVERLRPLLAGLVEVMPWVKQWHGEVDPEFGLSPYEQYNGYLEEKLHSFGLTVEDVKGFVPPKPKGGRTKKQKADNN